MKRTTYSKVNQPTKTASAISKKFSSSERNGYKTRLTKILKEMTVVVLVSQMMVSVLDRFTESGCE